MIEIIGEGGSDIDTRHGQPWESGGESCGLRHHHLPAPPKIGVEMSEKIYDCSDYPGSPEAEVNEVFMVYCPPGEEFDFRVFMTRNGAEEFAELCVDHMPEDVKPPEVIRLVSERVARREQMEEDCRSECSRCRAGDTPEICDKPPYVGRWVHRIPGGMDAVCFANAIRKAWEARKCGS